jgi:uncharacterized protein YggL (DUF469 family)
MKKRLRKKKHLREFREWGAPLAVRRRHPDGFDDFLDDFVEQAIEAQGLWFGGGGHDDRLIGVIEVGRAYEAIEARLQPIRRWLEAREDIEAYVVGTRVDLWHGPFGALDAIAERLP